MPPSGGSHSFEHWLETQPQKANIVNLAQSEPGQTGPSSKTLFIADELLVASQVAPKVKAFLDTKHVKFVRLASLLQQIKFSTSVPKPSTDVEVWRLLPPHPPVLTLVEQMWAGFLSGNQRAVTPNHVLIPASWGDQCPFGPPVPSTTNWDQLHGAHAPGGAKVTVIDAGYQWNPAWGTNPLEKLVHLTPNQGSHPKPPGTLTPTTGPLTDTQVQGTWVPDRADRPDYNGDRRLDALAGHGNFVLGVLAQYSNFPRVALWNHFGGFYPDPNEYTRELSVCHSLIESHVLTKNPLINLGFAFSPLKNKHREDVLSLAWDIVFQVLAEGVPEPPFVITPAGNQGTTAKRYPGALSARYPGRYANVKAVASYDQATRKPSVDVAGSVWSNYGDWVACSAMGADVTSTFLHVKMATQDDMPPYPVKDFQPTNTAVWSGTCFAAPKVTASVAEQYVAVNSVKQAWQNVMTIGSPPVIPGLGYVLSM